MTGLIAGVKSAVKSSELSLSVAETWVAVGEEASDGGLLAGFGNTAADRMGGTGSTSEKRGGADVEFPEGTLFTDGGAGACTDGD